MRKEKEIVDMIFKLEAEDNALEEEMKQIFGEKIMDKVTLLQLHAVKKALARSLGIVEDTNFIAK